MIAQALRAASPLAVVIVEAFPDRARDASAPAQALAAERAEKVRNVLVREGLAAETITAAAGDPAAPPPNGASLVISADVLRTAPPAAVTPEKRPSAPTQ